MNETPLEGNGTAGRRGRRGRRGREGGDKPAGVEQLPWRQPRNPYRPVEVVSADELESIHEASLQIL